MPRWHDGHDAGWPRILNGIMYVTIRARARTGEVAMGELHLMAQGDEFARPSYPLPMLPLRCSQHVCTGVDVVCVSAIKDLGPWAACLEAQLVPEAAEAVEAISTGVMACVMA